MRETMKLTGILTINIFKKGVLIDTRFEKNLILDIGKQNLAVLLAGDPMLGANCEVTEIAFGDDPNPVTAGDTSVANEFAKPIDSYNFPAQNQVAFVWALAEPENNGVDIYEFALKTGNGDLFSKRVLTSPIEKTADIRLEGTWTIGF